MRRKSWWSRMNFSARWCEQGAARPSGLHQLVTLPVSSSSFPLSAFIYSSSSLSHFSPSSALVPGLSFPTGFYLFPFPFVLPAGPAPSFPHLFFVSHNFLLSVSSFLPSRRECFLFPTLLKYLEPICFLLFCCLFPPTVLRPCACVRVCVISLAGVCS